MAINNIITCMTGNENITPNTAKFYVFWTPTRKCVDLYGTKEEKNIQIQIEGNSPITFVSKGYPERAMAGRIAEFGTFVNNKYDIANGTVLKIFAQRQLGLMSRQFRAGVFLKVDEKAPYYQIKMDLTKSPGATFSETLVEGRFHLLTLEDAQKLGITVPPMFASMFLPNMTQSLLKVSKIAEGIGTMTIEEEQNVAVGDENISLRIVRKSRNLDL